LSASLLTIVSKFVDNCQQVNARYKKLYFASCASLSGIIHIDLPKNIDVKNCLSKLFGFLCGSKAKALKVKALNV